MTWVPVKCPKFRFRFVYLQELIYNAGTSILERERKNIYSISYKLLINTELAVCTGELEVNNYKRNIMCAFK